MSNRKSRDDRPISVRIAAAGAITVLAKFPDGDIRTYNATSVDDAYRQHDQWLAEIRNLEAEQ